MHQTWHVSIKQATSANDMQHQPILARMSCGVCVFGWQHRRHKTTCTISQGICALGKIFQLMKSGINHEKLVVDRPYWSWLMHIALSILVVKYMHRLWLVHIRSLIIESGLCASIRQILSWSKPIGSVISIVACAYRPCEISCGLCASAKRHRPTTGYKSQCLHVSIFAYVHQLNEMFMACMN